MVKDSHSDADCQQHHEEASQQPSHEGHVLPMAWRIGKELVVDACKAAPV